MPCERESGTKGMWSTQKASRVFLSPTRSTPNLVGCQGEEGPVGLVKSVAGYKPLKGSPWTPKEAGQHRDICSSLNTQCISFVLLMREPCVLYRLVLQSAALIQLLCAPEKINHKFKCLWGWSYGKECNWCSGQSEISSLMHLTGNVYSVNREQ